MSESIFFNGRLMPIGEARISPLDYGFLFGFSLYETIRAYGGQPFRLDAHLERMRLSAEKLGITLDWGMMRRGTVDVVRANGYDDARVRITVSAGEGTMTPDVRSCGSPTVVVMAGRYVPYPPERYVEGFKVILSDIRRNSHSPVSFMKSGNGLENMVARQRARVAGVDEALFLNEKGTVAEASGSNIFLVERGRLITAPVDAGILPGVTRAAVMEIAEGEGLDVVQDEVTVDRLRAADELFLTNSLIEVMPVTAADGAVVGGGRPGPVTRLLMRRYRDLALAETDKSKK